MASAAEQLEQQMQELQKSIRLLEGTKKQNAEDSHRILATQRATIDKLKKENAQLQDDLLAAPKVRACTGTSGALRRVWHWQLCTGTALAPAGPAWSTTMTCSSVGSTHSEAAHAVSVGLRPDGAAGDHMCADDGGAALGVLAVRCLLCRHRRAAEHYAADLGRPAGAHRQAP